MPKKDVTKGATVKRSSIVQVSCSEAPTLRSNEHIKIIAKLPWVIEEHGEESFTLSSDEVEQVSWGALVLGVGLITIVVSAMVIGGALLTLSALG